MLCSKVLAEAACANTKWQSWLVNRTVSSERQGGDENKWYLLHTLCSFDNKAFHNILETNADRNIYTKHSRILKCAQFVYFVYIMSLSLLFSWYCVRLKSAHCDPKKPYGKDSILPILRALIWPSSSFLLDHFAVTMCEVRLIQFNLMENFRRPWLLWRSALFSNKMPFTTPSEQWHGPLNKLM